MKKNDLKNLRYSNMIHKIIVGMSSSYFTVSFRSTSPGLPMTGCPTSYAFALTNRDGTVKKFRSSKSLHAFLQEFYSWPVHPDLVEKDILLSTIDMWVFHSSS